LKDPKSTVSVTSLHCDEPAAGQIFVEADTTEEDGGVFPLEIDDLRRQAITKLPGAARNAVLWAINARNSKPIAVTYATHYAAVPSLG
jgi:hypothetical protein